jgi:AAA15 family ATPase/GTPase
MLLMASRFYANHLDMRDKMSRILSSWDMGLSDIRVEKRPAPLETGELQALDFSFGVHRVGEREHILPFHEESNGTQGAFVLLSHILPVLQDGGLVIIDELEADLHPHMLRPLLDLFFSAKTNPHNAQIIFTCHSMEVLNLLHKAQVVLVEKNEQCESSAWRLDTVRGIRSDDNLYAKYMAGAYGAVPQL